MPNRDDRPFEPRDSGRGGREEEAGPRGSEAQFRALFLLDRILGMTRNDDPKVINHLLLLRHQLETDEAQLEEAQKLIFEYEEAYQKLTAPANRVATSFSRPLMMSW